MGRAPGLLRSAELVALDRLDYTARAVRDRGVPVLAAGEALCQDEIFGIAVDDLDFLRGVLRVERQVRLVSGRQVFAPPKGGRRRELPLFEPVAFELAEQLRQFEPVQVTLPWEHLGGELTSARLLFTTQGGRPLHRSHFAAKVWNRALRGAGVPPGPANGIHALRHSCASRWLAEGMDIRSVSEYLGHHDPGFTLRTYTHVMPSADERNRRIGGRTTFGRSTLPGADAAGP